MSLNKNFLVSISNDMVEKPYSLTSTEQIIIELLASNIQPEDTEFKPLQFKTKEFMNMLGIKNRSTYSEIKDICKGLLKKGFKHSYIDSKGSRITLMVNWLSSAKIDETEGIIELRFDDNLKPYLLKLNELKEGFTSYKLINPINLKSAKDGYHIRIYKLLKKYQKIGNRQISIIELKEMLGIESTKYKLYTDFKRWVIHTAQSNINAKTDIYFEYEEIKSGRKITDINFIIKRNPINKDYQVPKEYLEAVEDEKVYEELLEIGISPKTAKGFINKYPIEHIRNNIYYTNKEFENGKVKNITSYLVKAIKDNYYKQSNLFDFNKSEEVKKHNKEIDKLQVEEEKKKSNEEILSKLQKWFDSFRNSKVKEYLSNNIDLIESYLQEYLSNLPEDKIGKDNTDTLLTKTGEYVIDNIDDIKYIELKLYLADKYLELDFIDYSKSKGYTVKEEKDSYGYIIYSIE